MTAVPLRRDLSSLDDILSSMHRRIDALELDLRGMTVVTEAATGAYACTAPIAAMAGARVLAVARDTASHGRAEDAFAATQALADQAGVSSQITYTRDLAPDMLTSCDILTNSGHLRPITASMIGHLPRAAVIALMFEAWEFREGDLDLAACRQRGIRVAAVNECHPDIDVFSFLGPLCLRLLETAGSSLPGARIALLCDNPFAPFIQQTVTQAGATVTCFEDAHSVPPGPWDAIVVSLNPSANPVLDRQALAALRAAAPSARLAQFWGDIDREAAESLWPADVWPRRAPKPGHMALLLSELGHEPIVRLQTGGLKAAELVFKLAPAAPIPVAALL